MTEPSQSPDYNLRIEVKTNRGFRQASSHLLTRDEWRAVKAVLEESDRQLGKRIHGASD
jgi:hypothetical protein